MKSAKPPPSPAAGAQRYVRFNKEIAERICQRIAAGESWARISADDDMPSYTAIYAWLRKAPAFAEAYQAARQAAADWKFDQVWDIAEGVEGAGVPQAKLKIDALRWQAARMAPRTYGDGAKAGDDRQVTFNIQVVRFDDDQPEDS